MNRIIEFSLKNRMLVLILFAVFIGISVRAVMHTTIDAFPDTTPVQVQINTVASNLNPTEIEQQITLPIELSISGFSGLINVRSISKFGLSQVVATFDDDTDIYDARQFIIERLVSVDRAQLWTVYTVRQINTYKSFYNKLTSIVNVSVVIKCCNNLG